MDFASTFACSFVAAPVTFASKSAVAPSPSPAIFFASVSFTTCSAAANCSYSGVPQWIFGFFALPFARSSTVSFVEVSPSTEIILYVSLTSSLNALCSAFFVIAASVVINASIVHIFGWIIPDHFAIPPIVTVSPPISNVTAISFSFVSVVMIAFAASCPAARSSAFILFQHPDPRFDTFHRDLHSDHTGGSDHYAVLIHPNVCAACSAVSLQICIPFSPVHAFAIPEFTMTAWHFTPESTT